MSMIQAAAKVESDDADNLDCRGTRRCSRPTTPFEHQIMIIT